MRRKHHQLGAIITAVVGMGPGLTLCYAAVFGAKFSETQVGAAGALAIGAYLGCAGWLVPMPSRKEEARQARGDAP